MPELEALVMGGGGGAISADELLAGSGGALSVPMIDTHGAMRMALRSGAARDLQPEMAESSATESEMCALRDVGVDDEAASSHGAAIAAEREADTDADDADPPAAAPSAAAPSTAAHTTPPAAEDAAAAAADTQSPRGQQELVYNGRCSTRQAINAATQQSLTEVAARDGEPPYRPFDLYDGLLASAVQLPSGGAVAATLCGLSRVGPFKKNQDELSAERAVVVVAHQDGAVGRIDTVHATNGETWRLRVRCDESDGELVGASCAETAADEEAGVEHEADIIHITRGFRMASLDAPSPTADADAAPSFLSTRTVATMADAYEKVRRGLETDWHEQKWRGSTNDPNRHEHLSTEFGWSTMAGGSEKQMESKADDKPFRLSAWEKPEGKAFYDEHVEPLLDDAWRLLAERHPKAAAEMLAAVPEEYRLKPEVGFTKVTVAVDNPTPLHYDDGNFGATFLASFEIDSDGALVGGSHVLCCNEEEQVVIVGDCAEGVVFLGDYRRVLHSNAARRGGRRFVVTAYCSKSLKELAARNRAKK